MFDRQKASPYILEFYIAFNEGADCPRLYELRKDAKQQGADNQQQQEINDKLRSVGCITEKSRRVEIGRPNTGNFTVTEYKIYREIVDLPISISEEQALDDVARKYKISVSEVRNKVNKVQSNLSKNGWMNGNPKDEIRYASDWAGETP
ncbi:hypothetical protein W02_30960 [Nitrospira sp. KM1]|nr:hypothetical protein W02_30960 [Nitrospira sp. KM1]